MQPHPYRQAFEARDLEALTAQLADDVVFHSPIISGQAFEGRESVSALLEIALDSVEDVSYTHEFGDERSHVLVSDGRVLGKPVKTSMLLEFDGAGKVREIWVMARPLSGAAAIAEAIGSGLVARENPRRAPAIRALSKPLAGLAAVTDRIGSRLIADLNRSTA